MTESTRPPCSPLKVGLMVAIACVVGTFAGATLTQPATAKVQTPGEGVSLVMEVSVGPDADEYVLDSGMRLGECAIAARGLKSSYRTYRGVRIVTTYACVR